MLLLALARAVNAQPAPQPLAILDVPFISQSEALCGGAAAAMVLRYWGERGLTAESFAHLVDRRAAGIRTTALVAELRHRGWEAAGVSAGADALARELTAGRPVIALIEDRPGTFHYVVVVAATDRVVVFHDPARAPFRVAPTSEFVRRWEAADRWIAVVTPRAPQRAAGADGALVVAVPTTACEQLVADGIRHARENNLDAAERALTPALACPGSAAFRELAGVRVLQRRWADAADLAAAALAQDPDEAYAWRVLATSRFVRNDADGALEAWNRIGEPRIDLLRVNGLTHTRQRVVERLVDVPAGSVLSVPAYGRAARRLAELPSAATTRLEYVPVPGGLAELRANVFERTLLPSSRWDYIGLGLAAAARREIAVPVGSITGGGERIAIRWRFWNDRPLYGVEIAAPAPWGGTWSVDTFFAEQPFDAVLPAARRTSASMTLSDWATDGLRWSLRTGVDRWGDTGADDTGDAAEFGPGETGPYVRVGGGLRVPSRSGRVETRGDVDLWAGASPFAVTRAELAVRTSRERLGPVLSGRGGFGVATTHAPPDLWLTGDTGHVSPILLRAHPALDDGRLRVSQLGRTAVYGTAEAQYWWRSPWPVRVGSAAFVDLARFADRFFPDARGDVDAGLGARIAVPGLTGTLRLDVARGMRDGATAVSFAYEPW